MTAYSRITCFVTVNIYSTCTSINKWVMNFSMIYNQLVWTGVPNTIYILFIFYCLHTFWRLVLCVIQSTWRMTRRSHVVGVQHSIVYKLVCVLTISYQVRKLFKYFNETTCYVIYVYKYCNNFNEYHGVFKTFLFIVFLWKYYTSLLQFWLLNTKIKLVC